MPDDLAFASIATLAPLLRARKVSSMELVQTFLSRIERLNPRLNCFITVLQDQARKEAASADRALARGDWRGPLHGIPVAIKDNIWTREVRTTAGSKILADFIPQEDAAVVAALRRAGAVILGKTNLHEFAYGVTCANAHFGAVHNPWDITRIPGGSSGGSAAALAAGLCVAAMGTDTGGSIRIPAAMCGVVGLKPTFGRVSCYGVIPLARSLDHAGPLARSAADAAILLKVLAGYDPRDHGSARNPVENFVSAVRRPLRRVRIGWPRDLFFERVGDDIRGAVEAARRVFEGLGAQVIEVRLPHVGESLRPATEIALAEAAQYHRAAGFFPACAAEYSQEVRARLETGSKIAASDYLDALEARTALQQEFNAALKNVTAIFAPTVPVGAPKIGEESIVIDGEAEDVRTALVRLNRPSNLTGLPAISLPCGFTAEGMPIGLQIIGRAFDEAHLLQLGAAYQQRTDWHTRRPPLV